MSHPLEHRHIVLTARRLAAPPREPAAVIAWLARLVAAVGMRILIAPVAAWCDEPGNEGCTGTVVLTTSHASIHCWSEVPEPHARIDLYSCRDFHSRDVLRLVEEFAPADMDWMLIDRAGEAEVIERGRISR